MTLQGRTAIITGCSRGLGVAIAEAMWREGANLLLASRSIARLRELQERLAPAAVESQEIHILDVDLKDPDAPRALMAEARKLWPKLDILVNNAASGGPIGMLADNDWAEWRDTVQLNLLAPAELCQLAVAWMGTTGGGSIVNISGGGATGPRPRFSAYATSKCGLVRFSETVAAETAELGIRVNCVSPGPMNTEMMQEALRAGPERLGAHEYERTAQFAAGAATDPAVAAELVVHLASPESAGITGKLISAVWDPWRSLKEHLEELKEGDVYTLRRIVPSDRGKEWGNV